MKEMKANIQYKDKTYTLVFDLNVMEQIQDEYGTIDKWANLTDGKEVVLDKDGMPVLDENGMPKQISKEVNAKALKFGIWCMINEGIDIKNDDNGTNEEHITKSLVGRMLTDYGIERATEIANGAVIESIDSDDGKNV